MDDTFELPNGKTPHKPRPPRRVRPSARAVVKQHKRQLKRNEDDRRWRQEMKQMQEVSDLDEIDDDVEDAATLYAWRAVEHNHQPKSAGWFVALSVGTTLIVFILVIMANFLGAITIGLIGGLMYYIVQRDPDIVLYRLMVDGVAIGNTLYHYRDIDRFNIVYEPDQTKTVLLHSNRPLAPILHMEIGDADPLQIRDILLEFVREDDELEEPIADVLARRFGF